MRIVFTTAGNDLEAALDPRFGRAPGFLLYDTEGGATQTLSNAEATASGHGAGIQAAQTVAGLKPDVLITGHCGPNAFRALQAAGIQICQTDARTVREALDAFTSGRLTPATEADKAGHWT
ncbi:MAG: dinitrogenase iron-molybdenum cofactor biosynthesis protein [Gaiellales bacterium]|nr:dinitrogenase iron-molybdenum cofactor biosynthesis protein [Gaiellales bacterium]